MENSTLAARGNRTAGSPSRLAGQHIFSELVSGPALTSKAMHAGQYAIE